ncbi:MAG: hypothetical protein K0S08_927 [Gammaproteobacteria bacterium]|jgi:opacity protein-like surface antigen|nr:hypothetical protein [Gammaproteobacteria bacterium]
MIKKILFVTALTFSSTATFAQSMPYIGGDAGILSLSSGIHGMFIPWISGANGRVFVGNLWGDTHGFQYGVEGAAMYFPHASIDLFGLDTAFSGYSLSALGVAKYVFNSGFLVLGKAGVAYLHEKLKDSIETDDGITIPLGSESGSKFAPEAAIGIGYQFNPKSELDLTADSIFAGYPNENTNNPVAQTNTLNLGFTYHFA